MSEHPPLSALFVCTGNTCRSAYAEAYARARGIDAASAGTSARDGERSPADAVAVASERGIDLNEHRARRLTDEIAQDRRVISLAHIIDPWDQGTDAYRASFDQIEAEVDRL
jgi:protein-tyrosine-phosphatase